MKMKTITLLLLIPLILFVAACSGDTVEYSDTAFAAQTVNGSGGESATEADSNRDSELTSSNISAGYDNDDLDSMSFGVPAKIGPYGLERIYELPVEDIREQIERSAGIIKEDIKMASEILKEKFGIG